MKTIIFSILLASTAFAGGQTSELRISSFIISPSREKLIFKLAQCVSVRSRDCMEMEHVRCLKKLEW